MHSRHYIETGGGSRGEVGSQLQEGSKSKGNDRR